MNTIIQRFYQIARQNPDAMAQKSRRGDLIEEKTYGQVLKDSQSLAGFLLSRGIQKSQNIGLFSENCWQWAISDLGILSVGAVSIPKGADVTLQELRYIISFCEISLIFIENKVLLELIRQNKSDFSSLRHVVVFESDSQDLQGEDSFECLSFNEALLLGATYLEKSGTAKALEDQVNALEGDDIYTIIFTSGTTGEPKGVMLSHRSMVYQVDNKDHYFKTGLGDVWLCVLPIWHVFQRLANYVILLSGATMVYSKPIPQRMRKDLTDFSPHFLASVPRIWSAFYERFASTMQSASVFKKALFSFFFFFARWHRLGYSWMMKLFPEFSKKFTLPKQVLGFFFYILTWPFNILGKVLVFSKVKKLFGGRLRGAISGGGKLPRAIDDFFSTLGIRILESYGLTESAPGVSMRSLNRVITGLVGTPLLGTEIQIRCEENNRVLKVGEKGIVFVRGPQIMKGYYKRPDLTAAVLDKEGWLNTGDLGRLTIHGELEITGRAKDTIVLLGGENVEPLPIEEKIKESLLIEQIVVLGQEQKQLGALIVLNWEKIKDFSQKFSTENIKSLINSEELMDIVRKEIRRLINPKNGYKPFEAISQILILEKPFEVGKELSLKLEVKRKVIVEMYKNEIERLFSKI